MQRFLTLAFTSLLVLIFIPACNLTADVPTPTPFNLDTVQTAVAATLAAQPSATSTLEPTAAEVPSQVPAPQVTNAPQQILFATGGTWTEVANNARADQPVHYVLRALQGQVMSVAVLENLGYRVTITGADGALLTIPNHEDSFWRGALPATQDYLITVSPPVDGFFTMRVAINPIGQTTQMFSYENTLFPLSLSYPDSFAVAKFPYEEQLRGTPMLALNFIDTAFYDKTNLSEAYFVLSVYTDPAIVSNCNQPSFPQEEARGQETINGITYDKSFGGGVGAGNYYIQTAYRTVQKNACVEVTFFVHYTNVGNYADPTIKEYDDAALTQQFMDVLKTLNVK